MELLHGHGDEIEEEPRGPCQALWGEGWQRLKLVGFSDLEFSAEIACHAAV
jgi:hypothetical protein